MFHDDEDDLGQQFQRAQNDVEYLKFDENNNADNISSAKQQFRKTIKENVSLKFQRIKNQNGLNNGNGNYKNMNKNISFQSEQSFDNNRRFYQDDYDDGRSSLGYYYENHKHAQLVYKKSRNLGTQWIGERQYYTSLFANPLLIQKFYNKCLFGKLKDIQQQQTTVNPLIQILDKNTLNINPSVQFDSDFQSGNLFCVYKVGILQYDLLLQNDINTKGNTQWFYFRMKNLPLNKPVIINIVNFRKSDSLFNYGMLPCVHSLQNQKQHNIGWVRKGSKLRYFRNNHQIQNSNKFYYTLTFTITTEFLNDVVKVAQCYPYTLGDLHNFFEGIQKINYKKDKCHRVTVMSKTLGGNKIQSLVIKESNPKIKNNDLRPLIIVIARQHPGETPGSFMIEGLIDYFLSKDKDSQFLRKNYQIRAIPMVNPDGVQAGNYRTNLYGVDLNRRWDCLTKQRQFMGKQDKQSKKNIQASQAIHIKKYISAITKGRQIAYILDFHGHSRKLYSFFYGNSSPQSPSQIKIFPYICSKLSSMISYEDSTFNVEEQKRSTARIQFLINYKALNIFTFEASFFGYIAKNKEKKHFTIESYKNLGMLIGKAIYICQKRKQDTAIQTKQKMLYEKWFKQLNSNNVLIKAGQKQDSGSESCPQECQIQQFEATLLEQEYVYQQQQSKRLSNTTAKATRQKFRHQNLNSAKQPQKTLRQMQVLDIARVNSIFPNDILALVPNTFYLKSNKNSKKQQKSIGIQTQPCPIIKVYQSCKFGQSAFFDTKIKEQTFIESKSVVFERQKSKSIGSVFPTSSSKAENQTLFQATLKNLSTMTVGRSKSIHEKQLYENARHLNALKKSTDIRRHFKKILTEHQLSKPKTQFSKSSSVLPYKKVNRHIQTIISFNKQTIVKLTINRGQKVQSSKELFVQQKSQEVDKQRMTQSRFIFDSPQKAQLSKEHLLQNPSKFWTIESRRHSLGLQSRQFNTPVSRNQFRKTTVNTKSLIRSNLNEKNEKNQKLIENWRIKKKRLI